MLISFRAFFLASFSYFSSFKVINEILCLNLWLFNFQGPSRTVSSTALDYSIISSPLCQYLFSSFFRFFSFNCHLSASQAGFQTLIFLIFPFLFLFYSKKYKAALKKPPLFISFPSPNQHSAFRVLRDTFSLKLWE